MDWRHEAACLDEDPELFFPIGNTGPAILQLEEAKAVCRRCEVTETCLRWALDTGQDAGVWGGLSEDERRSLKRRNARRRSTAFAAPKAAREPRGGFAPLEPTRAIIADAQDRGWSPQQVGEATGLRTQMCIDIVARRQQYVTELTARKVAAADLSGLPPVPADAPSAAGRC